MYPPPYFQPFLYPFAFNMIPLYPPCSQVPHSEVKPEIVKEEKKMGKKITLTRAELEKQTYQADKKVWTEEEDHNLSCLLDKNGLSFPQATKKMEGRTYSMCYSRYNRLKLRAKKIWSKTDDEKLINMVQIIGQDWKSLSPHFQGRTSQQIRERYLNVLKAEITNERWTIEEDLKFIQMINKYGNSWKNIEKQMPHRSQNQLKNRYYNRIKKIQQRKNLNATKP